MNSPLLKVWFMSIIRKTQRSALFSSQRCSEHPQNLFFISSHQRFIRLLAHTRKCFHTDLQQSNLGFSQSKDDEDKQDICQTFHLIAPQQPRTLLNPSHSKLPYIQKFPRMPHCDAFKSNCAAKELPTALNVLHAHGSLRGADIDIFTSVDVCIHFILWNILFCKCLTVVTVFFKISFLVWLCGIRTDQQAELLGRQGSGSISCHEHKSL